jgi:ribosome-binding protein aMBF1 (putative translation factor)
MKMTKTMKKKQVETYRSELIDKIYESISPLEEKKVETKMLLAAKIEDAIKEKGWKKGDLLKALGKKNPSILTRWLSGTHNFTIDTLIQLEEVLKIELINIKEKKNQITIQINSEINTSIYYNNKFIPINEPVVVYTTQFGKKLNY